MRRVDTMLDRLLGPINGPLEMGRSWPFWLMFVAVIVVLAFMPTLLSRYELLNFSNMLSNVFLALGLCLIWGFAGILSLGQSAFLGLGGYAYGIVGINLMEAHGNTWLALLAGLGFPVLVAAFLGWLMFYGRLKGVYVAILMLVVALLIETFLNQTAGQGWSIGDAHLGGNNGLGRFSGVIREPPTLTLGFSADGMRVFESKTEAFYYLIFGLGVICYLALRALVNSRLGHILVAIREDPDRTETLGYNVRLIQVFVFCIAALLASLSGILYVSWGNFITPDVFSVYYNILPTIWVALAGRKSLTATVIGTVFLVWLSQKLAIQGEIAFVVLGSILLAGMMLLPEGVLTGLGERIGRVFDRLGIGRNRGGRHVG
jgi:branched-chain amino acid transport system permease protein